MRIQDLVVSDFPGIDQEKFAEWKDLQIKANRAPWIGLAALVGVGIVSVPLIGGGIGWLLPVIAYFVAMSSAVARGKRLRELNRELGMREKLKAKRQGKTSGV